MLTTLKIQSWQDAIPAQEAEEITKALENGQVLFLPSLPFVLSDEEKALLTDQHVDQNTKNISFDCKTNSLRGAICNHNEQKLLTQMISRYADMTKKLIMNLLPHYRPTLIQGRTSYRPVEIEGRKPPSFRKDDTRLHVDAFPANPLQGKRILRVFTNINPDQKTRVWRLGEPFPAVVDRFQHKISAPIMGSSWFLKKFKITKTRRTLYDHYMLQIHDNMKKDLHYQQSVQQQTVEFPSASSWIVYTDQVSHAAMSGQYTLEQTFYLPATALLEPMTAPLKVLEKTMGKILI